MGIIDREQKFRIVGESPDGSVIIIDGRGSRRRTRIVHCVECEAAVPEVAMMPGETLCWDCKVSAAQEERRLEKEARSAALLDQCYVRRKKAITAASPAWRDKQKIKEIYDHARRLAEETGEAYDVDHHYPLQGALCCGLHVPANLRVIPASQNRRKSNAQPLDESPATVLMIEQYGMAGLKKWTTWAKGN